MADPRFFASAGPFKLREIAKLADAELAGNANPEQPYSNVAPLDQAGPQDVSFLDNQRYIGQFTSSKAGACIIVPEHTERAPKGMALLLTGKPYTAYALVAQAFYPKAPQGEGVHPTASIDPVSADRRWGMDRPGRSDRR